MHLHRFYAAPGSFDGETVVLPAEESHHLFKVLRLRAGDEAYIFDGEGNEYRCEVREATRDSSTLSVIRKLADSVESSLDLVLAQAVGKGDKFDLVVQKTTELGVRRIVPLITEHTGVRLPHAQAERRAERWRRISLEALKQCGRRRLVDIVAPLTLEQFLPFHAVPQTRAVVDPATAAGDSQGAGSDGGIESQGQSHTIPGPSQVLLAFVPGQSYGLNSIDLSTNSSGGEVSVTVLVGPEGGWSPAEEDLMRARGCRLISVGPRVLRTETAGVVAVAITQYLFGDLSHPPEPVAE